MSTTPQDPGSDAQTPDPAATSADGCGEETVSPDAHGEGQDDSMDDLRTRRIFELRSKIARGDYSIDAEQIARRLVDHL